MRTLACIILFGLIASQTRAEDARLTEAQATGIATLIAKELYHNNRKPFGSTYDRKSGIWKCMISGPGFGGSLFIDIRDKDSYYRVLPEGPTPTKSDLRFRMSPSLKREIAKITEKKANKSP